MILTLLFATILSTFLYSYFTKETNSDGSAKELTRNCWQMRLIRWTIDKDDPQFNGYCPLFWSTWLCIFLIPFTLLLKGMGWLWGFKAILFPKTDKSNKYTDDKPRIPSVKKLMEIIHGGEASIGEVQRP